MAAEPIRICGCTGEQLEQGETCGAEHCPNRQEPKVVVEPLERDHPVSQEAVEAALTDHPEEALMKWGESWTLCSQGQISGPSIYGEQTVEVVPKLEAEQQIAALRDQHFREFSEGLLAQVEPIEGSPVDEAAKVIGERFPGTHAGWRGDCRRMLRAAIAALSDTPEPEIDEPDSHGVTAIDRAVVEDTPEEKCERCGGIGAAGFTFGPSSLHGTDAAFASDECPDCHTTGTKGEGER